jgi:twitching motility protein PilT
MISARSISADHLNLSPEIRDLAALADGLVLVTGARGSGKSTLMNSFVDLINRTRSDHVITIETEIGFVHESRRSFISQREVHDDPAAAGGAAQAALKEDPDVLVIEDLHTPASVAAALAAAESGRLVFASITAPSSLAAIETIVEMFPAGQRAGVRATLSRTLRAAVAQVLLRKAAGGRVTARELLLNSPAVAASIREGKPSEAAAALEAGQRHGMLSMNDALTGLVRGGTVHSAEAYRRAPDRAALLARLAREGVDTAFAERLP